MSPSEPINPSILGVLWVDMNTILLVFVSYLLPFLLLAFADPLLANEYGQSNAVSPEDWAMQDPPSNPNADPNAPRGFNSIRGGNQLYGTGANQGSGFVKDPLGNLSLIHI